MADAAGRSSTVTVTGAVPVLRTVNSPLPLPPSGSSAPTGAPLTANCPLRRSKSTRRVPPAITDAVRFRCWYGAASATNDRCCPAPLAKNQ